MKIGFIGIGNMGGAILSGYASSEAAKGKELLAFSRNKVRAHDAKDRIPALQLCSSGKELCSKADIVILGVKPKDMENVLREIAAAYDKDKLVVSMAAGINTELLQQHLGEEAAIIRIMPNTPAQVGEAMTSMSRNGNVTDSQFGSAAEIFEAVGRAEEVDEALIDCVIGVSGSSPAYTYMYIEALTDAAVSRGMDADKARIFAAQSVLGAAKMVLESPESLEQLRINVCSPNGTTIEAVNKLFDNGFMDKTKEGFEAAVSRSVEMTAESRKKGKQNNSER